MRHRIIAFCLTVSLSLTACGQEQKTTVPEAKDSAAVTLPSPPVDSTPAEMEPEPPKNPLPEFERIMLEAGLVDLQEVDSSILVELKYSTTDNFVKADVYGDLTRGYLRPVAAKRLAKANELLKAERPELTLLVYDGARPRRIQQLMWDTLKMPYKRNYLSDPKKGSVHNYGLAVDLTLADTNGTPLDMGTPFDFFGELAQPQLEARFLANGQLTQEQADNRHLLKSVMSKAGFYPIRTEWWHFNTRLSAAEKAKYKIIE